MIDKPSSGTFIRLIIIEINFSETTQNNDKVRSNKNWYNISTK